MKALKKFIKRGITVITTLHQPQVRILNLADKIIIMSEGFIVYDSNPHDIQERLNKIGIEKKEH